MFRTFSSLGAVALALGAWLTLPAPGFAQKGGKGGGGGGGGARSAPAMRGAPAGRSAPAVRSAPAMRSAPAAGAPVVRNAPANPAARAPAAAAAKNAPGRPGAPGRQGDANRNWNANNWNGNRGYYGHNGYYNHDHHHHDDFWPFFAYVAVRDLLGYPFGWGYGYSPLSWGYYGAGAYDVGPAVSYRDAYYPSYGGTAPYGNGAARDGRVNIQVRVPEPNAYVWINGQSTTSRGDVRDYTSPALESGYEYSYMVRAAWDDGSGRLRTSERQVPVTPGANVLVDFTQAPMPPAPGRSPN